jgi:hypothetical protein
MRVKGKGKKAKGKGDPEGKKTGDAPWKNLGGKRKSEDGDEFEGPNEGRDKKNRRLSSNASASSPSNAQPLMGPAGGSL